ncbi:hypothetical protein [Trichormus variabilis]|uniref:Uncharacterized protein n=1 Tax=Trichormus variabilis SAG 1403-4b TaxID=447716 RepID=A0A433UVC6_ANAVA|nr:hypothetical protein [Trichormus variabilis]MBD2627539.1 hypothetical protein [Trichormus variabilis FACHB-164]RUS97766.1 hypothetical protein DSM107003_16410 [Trichormus variabilis SAG 1403-4b]
MGVKGKRLSKIKEGRRSNTPKKFYTDCVVEDSESAKQEPLAWQPGSAKAQFGVGVFHKNFFEKTFVDAH